MVDPVPQIADAASATGPGCTSMPPTAGRPGLPSSATTAASSAPIRSSSNPHKWLFTPIDCSRLFSARLDDLRAAFALTPEYLRTSAADGVENLNEYGPALGRRFRALKLWAVLRCFGRAGLQATIREHVRLAEQFEAWVRDEPELGALRAASVLIRLLPARGRRCPQRGAARGRERYGEVYLSHTRLDGRHVLRLAVGDAQTGEDDVRTAWDVSAARRHCSARTARRGRSDARPRVAAHRL